MTCQEVIHGQKTPHLLIAKPLDHGHYADHPDWGCMSYNYDGTAIAGLNSHVFCQINSTNTGKDANGAPITWPGRVRAYIDAPGTTEFLHCEDCVMGVDGAVLVANHTSWAFWQAVKTTLEGQHWIDYRTTSGGMARPLVFDKQAHSDIDAFFGFYTTEVMQYRTVSDLGGEISGEVSDRQSVCLCVLLNHIDRSSCERLRWFQTLTCTFQVFARTVTFLAALLLASWGISRCIGTFLILLLIGQDALADGEEKRAILN